MQDKTFETALKELEEVTQGLAKGDLPLDEAIALFKRGNELSLYCQDLLSKAEGEIKQVLKGEHTAKEEDFVLNRSEYLNEKA